MVSENLKQLIKTLTGFTIAHSITLVLTTIGVFHVNARIVDIFVALSIVYIGVENLFVKSLKHRFWIASGFGLVHGFAFASNLRDAGLPEGNALFWSLLSFNLGVETAQVIICATAFPLLMLWKRDIERHARGGSLTWPTIVRIASCGIILIGGKWLIERLLGATL
jgi:TctA family transporter